MGATTGISWAQATFNCWWGCVEVSPGCDACYARFWAERIGFHVWGKDATRRFFSDRHWNEPLRWNVKAQAAGERRRVFCQSMADLGEERADSVGRELDEARLRLWDVIRKTPHLDWLLLTKRPRLYRALMPRDIADLRNVWCGVSVENRQTLWRVDQLLQTFVRGPRWVSYEPALTWVDFRNASEGRDYLVRTCCRYEERPDCDGPGCNGTKLDWIVIGGESQQPIKNATRPIAPFEIEWVERTIEAGRATGTAIFVKQFGACPVLPDIAERVTSGPFTDPAWPPGTQIGIPLFGPAIGRRVVLLKDKQAGADPGEWPEALRVQQFPPLLDYEGLF